MSSYFVDIYYMAIVQNHISSFDIHVVEVVDVDVVVVVLVLVVDDVELVVAAVVPSAA